MTTPKGSIMGVVCLNGPAVTLDSWGTFALLPNEVIVLVACWLRSATDAESLLAVSRAFHDMARDPLLWRALYMALPDVATDATPEAWGKDWRWLCKARTSTTDIGSQKGRAVGAIAYHSDTCVYHGEVVDGLPDGYGVLVANAGRCPLRQTCKARGRFAVPDPTIHFNKRRPENGDRFEGMWKQGVLYDGRFVYCLHGATSLFRGSMGYDASIVESPEVAAAFWVPISAIRETTAWGRALVRVRGVGEREEEVFRHGDYTVWGLTHRALNQFLGLLGP